MGAWPGTVRFCYDGGYIQTTNLDPYCNSYYNATSSTKYNVWRNTNLCAKRIKTISNSSTCPAGYVKCHPGVCALGSDCGITEIHFEQSPRSAPGWYSTNHAGTYINFRKDVGAVPITTFAIVHGQPTVCLNHYKYTAQINYDAIAVKANGCGKYGDFPNVTELESDLSINVFRGQSWKPSPTDLPGFSDQLQTQSAYLIAIPRLQLKDTESCLALDFHDVINHFGYLNDSGKFYQEPPGPLYFIILVCNIFFYMGMCVLPGLKKNDGLIHTLEY